MSGITLYIGAQVWDWRQKSPSGWNICFSIKSFGKTSMPVPVTNSQISNWEQSQTLMTLHFPTFDLLKTNLTFNRPLKIIIWDHTLQLFITVIQKFVETVKHQDPKELIIPNEIILTVITFTRTTYGTIPKPIFHIDGRRTRKFSSLFWWEHYVTLFIFCYKTRLVIKIPVCITIYHLKEIL